MDQLNLRNVNVTQWVNQSLNESHHMLLSTHISEFQINLGKFKSNAENSSLHFEIRRI